MGKIIEASFSEILPGEDGFNLYCLPKVIKFFDRHDTLLPAPVKYFNGKYLHLDGRHRLLFQRIKKRDGVLLYLAESKEDVMTREMFPKVDSKFLLDNNTLLFLRWFSVENDFRKINVKDYNEHFENLKRLNPFLRDEKSCREYLIREGYL
jgi:hypothetical protein